MALNDYCKSKAVRKYRILNKSCGLLSSEKFIFENYINLDDKILDLGCGFGRTTFPLYEMGYENILGADISFKMIEGAKKYSCECGKEIDFQVADACNMSYPSNYFDVVFFSFNGIMCIDKEENRRKAAQEINRVLKTGGKFIFTAYNRELNKKYYKFWQKEEKIWRQGKQNKLLEKFGDRFSKNSADNYVFVPTNEEAIKFAQENGFDVIFNKPKSKICPETRKDKKIEELMFYVCEKV